MQCESCAREVCIDSRSNGSKSGGNPAASASAGTGAGLRAVPVRNTGGELLPEMHHGLNSVAKLCCIDATAAAVS